MPLSSDPAKRAAQLANLRAGAGAGDGGLRRALSHGAHSEREIAPLAAGYLVELTAEFPNASERVLRLQARRLARLELLGRFEDEAGVLRNVRRGEPFPCVLLAERITTAYLATHRDLEAAERDTGSAADGLEVLRQRGAAIIEAREADDGHK